MLGVKSLVLSLCFLVGVSACGRPASVPPPADSPAGVVVTIEPLRMILEEMLRGTDVPVTVLLPPRAFDHDYEPKPSDAGRVRSARMIFQVAPDLDGWITEISERDPVIVLGMLPERERLEARGEHAHVGGHPHDGAAHHEGKKGSPRNTDPHFWTDPLAVRAALPVLGSSLAEALPEFREKISDNERRFGLELEDLHRSLSVSLAPTRGRSAITFHDSFRYLFHRHGIELAGVVEPLPGKEPSPRDLHALISEARRRRAVAIFREPQLPATAAENIEEATGIPSFELDPLGLPGESYRDWLTRNAEVLAAALGRSGP